MGNKLKLKRVPSWIKDNLVQHFLRGLADADFCLSFKKNRKGLHCEPRLELFTNNKIIAEFVCKSLRSMGFKVAFEDAMNRQFKEYRIRMYGKKMLDKWMKEIGFENDKHTSKVILFRMLGHVPKRLSTNQRLKMI